MACPPSAADSEAYQCICCATPLLTRLAGPAGNKSINAEALPISCSRMPPAPAARRGGSARRAGRVRRPKSPRRQTRGSTARRPRAAPAAVYPAPASCWAPGQCVPARYVRWLTNPVHKWHSMCRFCSWISLRPPCHTPGCQTPVNSGAQTPYEKLQGCTHCFLPGVLLASVSRLHAAPTARKSHTATMSGIRSLYVST